MIQISELQESLPARLAERARLLGDKHLAFGGEFVL